MSIQLHVPLEALVAVVALEAAGRQVAALYVGHQRRFVSQLSVADVADEALLNLRLLGEAATEAVEQVSLLRAAAAGRLQQQPERRYELIPEQSLPRRLRNL